MVALIGLKQGDDIYIYSIMAPARSDGDTANYRGANCVASLCVAAAFLFEGTR